MQQRNKIGSKLLLCPRQAIVCCVRLVEAWCYGIGHQLASAGNHLNVWMSSETSDPKVFAARMASSGENQHVLAMQNSTTPGLSTSQGDLGTLIDPPVSWIAPVNPSKMSSAQ
jgi:hypothetical protein